MPHIHEKYDFVVVVFIVNDGRVLLVNHPRYTKWIPVGGHIELDEDPDIALYREVKEETGLEVEILSHKPQTVSPDTKFLFIPNGLSVHGANYPHKHIGLTYYARTKTPSFKISNEHTDMRWFTPTELHDSFYSLSPEVIYFAEKALEADKNWD